MRPRTPWLLLVLFALPLAACMTEIGGPVGAPVAAMPADLPRQLPAQGDVALYRVFNAYNGEVRGELRYEVERVAPGEVVWAVTTSAPSEGLSRTEIYTPDGNGLRHTLVNHDRPVEYAFSPPYPAYAFPLAVGKSWSTRVNAASPASGRRASVRVDARVLGAERVMTPAGPFDTYKIRRQVYAGDWDGFLAETNITEFDWYAPALGRTVRAERNSRWIDQSRMMGGGIFAGGFMEMRGDWSIYELVSYRRAGT